MMANEALNMRLHHIEVSADDRRLDEGRNSHPRPTLASLVHVSSYLYAMIGASRVKIWAMTTKLKQRP
jgi:hypothetical protein